jgi:hypothetical protein
VPRVCLCRVCAQCVRHLPPQLATQTTAVEGMLAGEFLGAVAAHDAAGVVASAASEAEAQPGELWVGGLCCDCACTCSRCDDISL